MSPGVQCYFPAACECLCVRSWAHVCLCLFLYLCVVHKSVKCRLVCTCVCVCTEYIGFIVFVCYIHLCIRVFVCACIFVYIFTCTSICMWFYTFVCICIFRCMYIYVHLGLNVCSCVYVCVYPRSVMASGREPCCGRSRPAGDRQLGQFCCEVTGWLYHSWLEYPVPREFALTRMGLEGQGRCVRQGSEQGWTRSVIYRFGDGGHGVG